jgi:hypothetical protein
MNRLMHFMFAMAMNVPAWAADEPSNVTTTSWEIYGAVALALVVGLAWTIRYQKKEEEREKHRRTRSSSPA